MIFIVGLLISIFLSDLEAYEMVPTKDSGENVLSGLKMLPSAMFKLTADDLGAITEQCKSDFFLYKEAILNPSIKPNPETNQTLFDNFWAYKSKLIVRYYELFCTSMRSFMS